MGLPCYVKPRREDFEKHLMGTVQVRLGDGNNEVWIRCGNYLDILAKVANALETSITVESRHESGLPVTLNLKTGRKVRALLLSSTSELPGTLPFIDVDTGVSGVAPMHKILCSTDALRMIHPAVWRCTLESGWQRTCSVNLQRNRWIPLNVSLVSWTAAPLIRIQRNGKSGDESDNSVPSDINGDSESLRGDESARDGVATPSSGRGSVSPSFEAPSATETHCHSDLDREASPKSELLPPSGSCRLLLDVKIIHVENRTVVHFVCQQDSHVSNDQSNPANNESPNVHIGRVPDEYIRVLGEEELQRLLSGGPFIVIMQSVRSEASLPRPRRRLAEDLSLSLRSIYILTDTRTSAFESSSAETGNVGRDEQSCAENRLPTVRLFSGDTGIEMHISKFKPSQTPTSWRRNSWRK